MSEFNGTLKMIAVPLLVSAIIGAWVYSSTRASKADLFKVEAKVFSVELKGEAREEKINEALDQIEDSVHQIEVEQASFRAQVREALRIPGTD